MKDGGASLPELRADFIYLSKLPGLQKKVRVALDWTLNLIFSKDLVQLPTLRAPTMSEAEETTAPAGEVKPASTATPKP
jgi:hypothetical protein